MQLGISILSDQLKPILIVGREGSKHIKILVIFTKSLGCVLDSAISYLGCFS